MPARVNDACEEQYFAEELPAQVNGCAKVMVTVVATQALGPGDVLRRFKEEAAQDELRRGEKILVVVGLLAVGVRKLWRHMEFFSLVCCSFLVFVFVFVMMVMMMICTGFLMMFCIL